MQQGTEEYVQFTPGNRPASATPRKKRAAAKPLKLCTRPMQVMQMPQSTMMRGRKMLGRRRLSRMLVKGSNPA